MSFFVQPLRYGVKVSKENNVKLSNCRVECKKRFSRIPYLKPKYP